MLICILPLPYDSTIHLPTSYLYFTISPYVYLYFTFTLQFSFMFTLFYPCLTILLYTCPYLLLALSYVYLLQWGSGDLFSLQGVSPDVAFTMLLHGQENIARHRSQRTSRQAARSKCLPVKTICSRIGTLR